MTSEKLILPPSLTARQLSEMEFPEPRWVARPLLPEGTTLLVGPPKSGKSLLALNFLASVASGKAMYKELWGITVDQGTAVYAMLEGSMRGLQQRCSGLYALDDPPESLVIYNRWPRLSASDRGLELMTMLVKQYPDLRLVVFDTLYHVRPDRASKDLYKEDYKAVVQVSRLARELGINVLIVHHANKGNYTDPVDQVSGTAGLAAGVDNLLVLRGSGMYATVSLIPREEEQAQYDLKFCAERKNWLLRGRTSSIKSKERREIYDLLKAEGRPMRSKEIAEHIDGVSDSGRIRGLLPKMTESGEVVRLERGLYTIPDLDEVHRSLTVIPSNNDNNANIHDAQKVNGLYET